MPVRMNTEELRVGAAVGVYPGYNGKSRSTSECRCRCYCNRHSTWSFEWGIKMIKEVRKKFKYTQLIAGNIGTYEAALDLIEIVKLML